MLVCLRVHISIFRIFHFVVHFSELNMRHLIYADTHTHTVYIYKGITHSVIEVQDIVNNVSILFFRFNAA